MTVTPPTPRPLVSIAIPTYNRSALLPRSVRSILSQSHQDFEIIISDNGSTDDTPAVIAELAKSDPRIVSFRFEKNQGAFPNFEKGLSLARGDFFMWLADDDWLDPSFLATCVAGHELHPTASVVAGRTHYCIGETLSHVAEDVDILDPDPARRVVAHYEQAGHNGCFYGLFRRSRVPAFPRLPPVLGFDWVVMARAAFTGPIVTMQDTILYRDFDPRPGYHLRYAAHAWPTFWHRAAPGVALALAAGHDVQWAKDAYPGLTPVARAKLSARVVRTLGRRLDFSLANVERKLRELSPFRRAKA